MRVDRRLARVAKVLALQCRERDRPQVVLYLPRKDGDNSPVGVVSRSGNALTVLYDPKDPDPQAPRNT
jgi:hypothetical protein